MRPLRSVRAINVRSGGRSLNASCFLSPSSPSRLRLPLPTAASLSAHSLVSYFIPFLTCLTISRPNVSCRSRRVSIGRRERTRLDVSSVSQTHMWRLRLSVNTPVMSRNSSRVHRLALDSHPCLFFVVQRLGVARCCVIPESSQRLGLQT
jgi:hypothetical protein